MNKTLKKLIVPALCMLGMTAIVACDKNDSPAPDPPVPDEPVNPWDYDPTNPDEIPIISEAPTLFSGEENFIYDTIPTDAVGFPEPLVPLVAIYDDTISTITPTISHDKDIYFEYKGQKYCIGDTLPDTDRRNPIGHSVKVLWSPLYEFPEISLGCFSSTTDEPVILRWPKKNLSVYITPVRNRKHITLPENFHPDTKSTEGIVHTYGVYVNGVGSRWCGFSIRLTAEGKIKLFKGIRNGQP